MSHTEYVVTPLSRIKIRQYTNLIRTQYGLEGLCYFPIVPFLEWGFPENYIVVPRHEMGHYEGLMVSGQDIIAIREDVYDGAVSGDGRSRFTLAHEVGHYLLHRHDSHPRRMNARNIKPFENPEWQANNFASELLMPSDLVCGLSIDEIVQECGVTPTAAKVRVDVLSKEGLY